jgi:serine/threonine protein kinase
MLKSPHILTYIDFKETSTHIFIVLEYCNGGDVWKFLERRRSASSSKQLTAAEIMNIVRLLVKALLYLHEKKLIHRDIKPGSLN